MVTKETAERIAEICNEIEDCKQILTVLKGKGKCVSHFLFVAKNEKDEGITLSLSRGHALSIAEQELENLNTKYASLNKTALKEAE